METQGAIGVTGGSDAGDAYPNPHRHASLDDKKGSRKSGFKGSQGPEPITVLATDNGETEPGGNLNAERRIATSGIATPRYHEGGILSWHTMARLAPSH